MEDNSNNTVQNPGSGSSASNGQTGRPAGQNLGIAALITAIVTFVLAVIPCVGMIAIIPGIIAIVLAAVGLSQASRNDSPRGVIVAGLVIAVVASIISFSQFFVAGKIADRAKNEWGGDIENIIKDVHENVIKDLEDANVSIKVESNGEKVEINANTSGKGNLEEELEKLEKGDTLKHDTLRKGK
jgi:hypothetical protein